ncbi:MAG TPA: hypothetical protein VGS57_21255 [Thermoanaerobaculia bacterium]|jgi:hypothetical protein|nr:hypothetical protein [Thermoanaerobaculia bacterium]
MGTSRIVVAAVLAAACVAPAAAQLAPAPGGDLGVAEQSSSRHHQPAVALVRDGWLVAWDDEAQGLMVRRFLDDGHPRGRAAVLAADDAIPALPFSGRLRREAHEVAIAARPDGSFLAAWVDVKLRHSADGFNEDRLVVSRQLVARLFNAETRPISRTWALSSLDGLASRPEVVFAGDRFVVTWQEKGGDDAGVHARAVRPNGPAADQLLAPRGLRPAIAAGGDGSLVVWEKCCGAGDGYRVFARLLDRFGFADGEAFEVADDLPRGARAPAVAGQPGGDFLVAYQRSLEGEERASRIYGQLVSKSGLLAGGEVALSSGAGTSHTVPVAATLANDGWAVGWLTWVDGFRIAATVAPFTALGNADGNAVDLNAMPIVGLELALAASPDGRLVAAWEGFDAHGEQGLRARMVRGPSKTARALLPH